jgi:hypothetical protein
VPLRPWATRAGSTTTSVKAGSRAWRRNQRPRRRPLRVAIELRSQTDPAVRGPDPVFTGARRGQAGDRWTRRHLGEGAASTGHVELRCGEGQRRLHEGAADLTVDGSDPTPTTREGWGGASDLDAAWWPRHRHDPHDHDDGGSTERTYSHDRSGHGGLRSGGGADKLAPLGAWDGVDGEGAGHGATPLSESGRGLEHGC